MGIFRAYIKPFNNDGTYSADWIDVSDDVPEGDLAQLTQSLDNNDFDIGIFRNSSIGFSLDNSSGRYSDITATNSIFRFKRADTLVKFTWAYHTPAICGISRTEDSAYISPEVDVFIGLLNDDSAKSDIGDNKLKFQVLGRESLFERAEVPFALLSNGDLISEVLYTILNQSPITSVLAINPLNITVNLDQAIDDVASFENKTVLEALELLLFAGNSVLRIDGDDIIVSSRTASADVMAEFFSEGSSEGAENIENVKEISNGVSRMINYVTWRDTALLVQDDSSIAVYGVRKKELDFEFFTDNTKRTNIMQSIVSEFAQPKQEFTLGASVTYERIDLQLLDKCSIDYPFIPVQDEGGFPLWGQAVAGEAVAPKVLYSFEVLPLDRYKILSKKIDFKNHQFQFRMRAT